jgi:hypothetical protein
MKNLLSAFYGTNEVVENKRNIMGFPSMLGHRCTIPILLEKKRGKPRGINPGGLTKKLLVI